LRSPDPTSRITVTDWGVGFDPSKKWEDIGKFGLFTIKERLELLGGHMGVNSMPGKGSEIVLIAPAAETESVKETKVSDYSLSKHPIISSEQKTRILLVDDHTVVRQGLYMMLSFHHDIKIVGEASDGAEAVKLAREILPDVILMNISMPKMDGLETTRIIRSEFPHIRIIGFSLYGEESKAVAMINAGATVYCLNSGNTDALLAKIRGKNE